VAYPDIFNGLGLHGVVAKTTIPGGWGGKGGRRPIN